MKQRDIRTGRPSALSCILITALALSHLQRGVQHVNFAGLLPGLGQSKALRGSHPGDPLDHPLNPGEFHQHVLLLRTQPTHIHCVIERLTRHLCGEVEALMRTQHSRVRR